MSPVMSRYRPLLLLGKSTRLPAYTKHNHLLPPIGQHLRFVASNATSTSSHSLTKENISISSIKGSQPPLSLLPFGTLLRSYLISFLSTTPSLLNPSLSILAALAYTKSPILNPDRNPILKYVLKHTVYTQFCAGETPAEVKRTIDGLKELGCAGVMLGYAKEVVIRGGEIQAVCVDKETAASEVRPWRQGTLDTVRLAGEGDFLALKFTGAGSQALHDLAHQLPPSSILEDAITEICELAKARKVRLAFDAEQNALQAGIDAWTMKFQRRYNAEVPGRALVYGTYQAYLRSTPATLARHLAAAIDGDFTLGVKLVRGAYLGSDPRHLFCGSKEETDRQYNEIATALINREFNGVLTPLNGREGFPRVNVVLASHNLQSVRTAMKARKTQIDKEEEKIDLVFGQLMGMADHVTCELIQAGSSQSLEKTGIVELDKPKAYKYLVWGTVGECLTYLLRRAEENRDAVTRAEEGHLALRAELSRRLLSA